MSFLVFAGGLPWGPHKPPPLPWANTRCVPGFNMKISTLKAPVSTQLYARTYLRGAILTFLFFAIRDEYRHFLAN